MLKGLLSVAKCHVCMPRPCTTVVISLDVLKPTTVGLITGMLSTQYMIPHNQLMILQLVVFQCRQQKCSLSTSSSLSQNWAVP